MTFTKNYRNTRRLRKPSLPVFSLRSIFCVVAIIGLVLVAAKLHNKGGPAITISDREGLASTIASHHYQSPAYKDVYRHADSLQNLQAYLQSLDPYSRYMSPEEFTFREKRSKKYRMGIGLNLLMQGDDILGVPLAQGPAYQAGMVIPVYIRSINSRRIVYEDFSSYAFLAGLAAGEPVQLSVLSSNGLDDATYTIKAANHANNPLSALPYKDTLFIRIDKFVGGDNSALVNLLATAKNYRTVVIDLRYCPGGDLYAMVDMLSFILREGLDVAHIQKADGSDELPLTTLSGKMMADPPLAILVSEFTASTAEIFVWALKKHYPGVKVLGEPTKGKCLAQNVFRFDDGWSLNLTTFEVRNAFKQLCQGHPLEVDKRVPGIVQSDLYTLYTTLANMSPAAGEK